jgi:hypothetical protein
MSNLNEHRALVVTPTETKTSTEVSIGGATPVVINSGWMDNVVAGMSFYNMPLTNGTASYRFTNEAGLFVMGYGVGNAESYYYLAGSAMRNLRGSFSANDIYYSALQDTTLYCGTVDFVADIEGLHPDEGSLRWFINGDEEIDAQDKPSWSKVFDVGEYEIEMRVRYEDNSEASIIGTLKIQARWIKIRNYRK